MKEDIKDLIINEINSDQIFEDSHDLYESLDYSGLVHELICSNLDVYNYDLRKWAVDNWHWVDEALDQGIVTENTNYHDLIKWGQYMALQDEANGYIDELFNEMNGEYFNIDQTKTA
jgi:hypothetical protein